MMMVKPVNILVVCFLMVIFLSCGKSQRELAVAKINNGKALLAQGDTLKAIGQFDSVKLMYPKARVQIGVAANIRQELYRLLIDDRIRQLALTDTLIASLKKGFTKEKTEFDRYAQYIPLRQSFSRSWNRSYLQVNLDERGELFLTSHYMGKDWLNHTSIKVYDRDFHAVSSTVLPGDPDNRRSEFNGYKWEKVSYRNGSADSLIQFIDQHRDLKLKCVFQGDRYYYILLEDYDIQSIVDALALSRSIKNRKQLAEEIKFYRSR